ncbi:IF4E-domain-containing protein [Venturia nashicola]|nr:IF4E-domain-containing protein [Venturia nashicola]
MDKDRENLWSRRSGPANKLSLTTENDHIDPKPPTTRTFSGMKRFGSTESSHGGRFSNIAPLSTNNISSPTTTSASSAFGLGSGAFASFGSASKPPKTPGTAFDFTKVASGAPTPATPSAKMDKAAPFARSKSAAKLDTVKRKETKEEEVSTSSTSSLDTLTPAPLKYSWVVWYRPPTSKNSDYEKSIQPLCRMETVHHFWKVYTHMKYPSQLPCVSDYHFFREGIRPVWEDDANKKGGKWIMRLKKGVCDRYWEDLLMAMIGDQFNEASDEVCGAVVSVRAQEDILSIWTKNDGGRNVKIRETVKRVLNLPGDTNISWKSHDDSISQRSAIDQARQDKSHHGPQEKRRMTVSSDDGTPPKDRANAV